VAAGGIRHERRKVIGGAALALHSVCQHRPGPRLKGLQGVIRVSANVRFPAGEAAPGIPDGLRDSGQTCVRDECHARPDSADLRCRLPTTGTRFAMGHEPAATEYVRAPDRP
jgi:hypothetical protein